VSPVLNHWAILLSRHPASPLPHFLTSPRACNPTTQLPRFSAISISQYPNVPLNWFSNGQSTIYWESPSLCRSFHKEQIISSHGDFFLWEQHESNAPQFICKYKIINIGHRANRPISGVFYYSSRSPDPWAQEEKCCNICIISYVLMIFSSLIESLACGTGQSLSVNTELLG